jgi:hypothetical protein
MHNLVAQCLECNTLQGDQPIDLARHGRRRANDDRLSPLRPNDDRPNVDRKGYPGGVPGRRGGRGGLPESPTCAHETGLVPSNWVRRPWLEQ